MNHTIITYAIYLAMSIGFTVWVAQTLFRNGRVFLIHVFRDNYSLADSINHLLVVGFYLINLGYISLYMRTEQAIGSWQGSMELISAKLGVILLVLGTMHFLNMMVFGVIRSAKPAKPADESHI